MNATFSKVAIAFYILHILFPIIAFLSVAYLLCILPLSFRGPQAPIVKFLGVSFLSVEQVSDRSTLAASNYKDII
jgi:hypothetical protein